MELFKTATSYKENDKEMCITNTKINNIIADLVAYTDDSIMLTKIYTDILKDDNVMYILTKISQNVVFAKHFPEFYLKNKYGESVINCQQNTKYHKYGVFKHILCTIENVGKYNTKFNNDEIKILKWTMLLHDIGKPQVKVINDSGSDSFAGHENISYEMAKDILDRFSFSDKEKNTILALIKYHDKFLNEGELTYDNLSFLAKELDDNETLFDLLIEVKLADNRAKSIDVYNNFENVKNKYYQFANLYFKSKIKSENINDNVDHKNKKQIKDDKILSICKEIIDGKHLNYGYLPVIDIKNKKVQGYEAFCKIVTKDVVPYDKIIRRAKAAGLYHKLEQTILLKTLQLYDEYKSPKTIEKYINIGSNGYNTYMEKENILKNLKDKSIVLIFNNFETANLNDFKEHVNELRKYKIKTCIDNFYYTNKIVKNVDEMGINIVKYKLTNLEQSSMKQVKELVTFCEANDIRLIVSGVDSKDKLSFLLDAGVMYVQGEYFGTQLKEPSANNNNIKKIITNLQEDKIL